MDSETKRIMKDILHMNQSPCLDCPNLEGSHCSFYGEKVGSDPLPCDQCDEDCGLEAPYEL